MKLATQWKNLTRDQRLAWNAWAKSNLVLLDDGSFRRVSGHKAMTMVLRNRTLAGDSLRPANPPAAAAWKDGALSLRDAGPFTENAGYIGFRCDTALTAASKWFVWGTAPVLANDQKPLASLKFISVLAVGVLAVNDITGSVGNAYLPIQGDWHPPFNPNQATPAWEPSRRMWLRLHHYVDGQLSPGRVLSGQICYAL